MREVFLRTLDISASGLTAQKYRLDIIAQNITHKDTTRTEAGGPYRRQVVVFAPRSTQKTFAQYYTTASSKLAQKYAYLQNQAGVRVTQVLEDPGDNKLVYDPDHPDANAEGYVEMPNVDLVQEMIDMMGASRSYDANVTVLNTIKQMAAKALEIRAR